MRRPLLRLTRRHLKDIGWMQAFLPPLTFQQVRYLTLYGHLLPRRPQTFNERLFHKMGTDRNPLLTRTADQAGVRGYVEEVLGPGYLAGLYALLTTPEAVLDATLPSRYVAKPTHTSAHVMFVEQDDPATRARLAAAARDWFVMQHASHNGEWSYRGLQPRVIVEEWLTDGTHMVPPDWKWFCFHGHAGIVELDLDRYGQRSRNLYTPEGVQLDATLGRPRGPDVPVPATFAEMRRVAEALSRPFDFVRVDLYALGSRIVVGELTHYPAAGTQVFAPPSLDARLGALWGQHAAAHQSHHP